MMGLPGRRENFDDIWNRLDTVRECDVGQMDIQIERHQPMASTAIMHSK